MKLQAMNDNVVNLHIPPKLDNLMEYALLFLRLPS